MYNEQTVAESKRKAIIEEKERRQRLDEIDRRISEKMSYDSSAWILLIVLATVLAIVIMQLS